jgi:diguanylate cyclase (GGDEF)-like protein
MTALRLPVRASSLMLRGMRGIHGWQVWTLPQSVRAYVLGINALAMCATVAACAHAGDRGSNLLLGAALLACAIIAIESTRNVKEAHGGFVRDLNSVWLLAIAVALPAGYAFLAPFPILVYKILRIPQAVVYKRVFSASTMSLAYGSASLIFHAVSPSVAGAVPKTGSHALSWTAVVAACGLLGWIVNHGLLIVAVKLSDPTARIRDLVGSRESIASDLLELSLAVSLTLVVRINPVLVALGLPSVVLCKRSIMRAQLVSQARIDAKTGLLNSSAWQREAEAAFSRAIRKRTALAMAMVDIDDFKSVIESAGPSVADKLLRDIAGMLKDQLPGHDLIGRFGTEEFAILLPQMGRDEAKRLSERLRDHIAGEPIAIESGDQAGFIFRLTVSIGVAVLNESRRALVELIGAADSALEQAKSTGWNKVIVLADGTSETEESQGQIEGW